MEHYFNPKNKNLNFSSPFLKDEMGIWNQHTSLQYLQQYVQQKHS